MTSLRLHHSHAFLHCDAGRPTPRRERQRTRARLQLHCTHARTEPHSTLIVTHGCAPDATFSLKNASGSSVRSIGARRNVSWAPRFAIADACRAERGGRGSVEREVREICRELRRRWASRGVLSRRLRGMIVEE